MKNPLFWVKDEGMPKEVVGTVFYHKGFLADGLKPRDIFVWVPPGYDRNEQERYPVLYMHDGQNLIDPETSTNEADWQINETADRLIRSGAVAPFIIVGIYHTEDRMKEYNDEPMGTLYQQFVVEQLKPFIDASYRTMKAAEHTLVGGSSMGGLVSFMLAWHRPDVFSKAICFSPAFKYYEYFDYTRVIDSAVGSKKAVQFYFYNGGIGLDEEFQPGVDEMLRVLRKKGYEDNVDLFVEINPSYDHLEAHWAKVIVQPLKLFFGERNEAEKQ